MSRNAISGELKKAGFGGLDDPNIVQQLAFCVRDHEHLRSLLSAMPPEKRNLAYQQLRPHLRFQAKPLDVYISEMREDAERRKLPIIDPDSGEVVEFDDYHHREIPLEVLASKAIAQANHEKLKGLTLSCAKCSVLEVFHAKMREDAERESRKAGWRSDGSKNWCPKHVPTRGAIVLECAKCEKKERIRSWDPEDGYTLARLAGWVIDEEAHCPKCSTKIILVN